MRLARRPLARPTACLPGELAPGNLQSERFSRFAFSHAASPRYVIASEAILIPHSRGRCRAELAGMVAERNTDARLRFTLNLEAAGGYLLVNALGTLVCVCVCPNARDHSEDAPLRLARARSNNNGNSINWTSILILRLT